jgi:hypothetical protein
MGKKKGKKGKVKDPQVVAKEFNEKLVRSLTPMAPLNLFSLCESDRSKPQQSRTQIYAAMTNKPEKIVGNLPAREATLPSLQLPCSPLPEAHPLQCGSTEVPLTAPPGEPWIRHRDGSVGVQS